MRVNLAKQKDVCKSLSNALSANKMATLKVDIDDFSAWREQN